MNQQSVARMGCGNAEENIGERQKTKFIRSDSFHTNQKSLSQPKAEGVAAAASVSDEATEDVSESEEESADELTPLPQKPADSPNSVNGSSNNDRRGSMMRQNSMVIAKNRKSHHSKLNKSDEHKLYKTRNQPITFLELIEREAREKAAREQFRKSSLHKKRPRRSSLKFEQLDAEERSKTSTKKAVRFATNANARNKVWALVREYNKVSERKHEDLWWSPEKLYDRYDKDRDTVSSQVGKNYRDALLPAYDPTKRASQKLDWDEEAILNCSEARGLEAEVCNEIAAYVKSHWKAVLKTQAMIDQVSDEVEEKDIRKRTLNESEVKLIRLQSMKFSRRSSLLATKMAELDHAAFARDEEDEHVEAQ